MKGGRFITHLKRLRDVEVPLANFFASGVLALGPKLGPLLWQLAARHDDKLAEDRAHTTTDAERPVGHALEFRSTSFCTDEAFAQLREHGVACVLADTAGRWPKADADTADLRYVRLHGDAELYASGYSDRSLDAWAERCREWSADHDVHVYFDNDVKGHAPWDAVRLLERLRGR